MKTNFSMLFYTKKQKNYKSGLVPIYLRFTVDGKRAEVTTGRECDPEQWNNKSGRVKGTKDEVKRLNMFLDNLQTKVYEAHRYLSENENPITANTLKNRFLGKEEKPRMVIEIFAEHNQKMAVLLGKEFANGTFERYKTSLRHTQEFLNARYGISDIDIRKVDHSFISEYEFYLRSSCKCANNASRLPFVILITY